MGNQTRGGNSAEDSGSCKVFIEDSGSEGFVFEGLDSLFAFLAVLRACFGGISLQNAINCAGNLEKCMLSELGGGMWRQLELRCKR